MARPRGGDAARRVRVRRDRAEITAEITPRSAAESMATCHRCAEAMHSRRRSVLVHCSDGWDRTMQICALVQVHRDIAEIPPRYRRKRRSLVQVHLKNV